MSEKITSKYNKKKQEKTGLLTFLSSISEIWWVETKETIKDQGLLIFFIIVPLFYPLLYSWIYNNEVVRDVPVAIVDLSHSQSSRQFIKDFDASPDVHATYYCNNIKEAEMLVGKQAVYGVLYFPSDFDNALHRGQKAYVGVYCDMSLMLTYKAIYQSALSVALEMGTNIKKSNILLISERDEEVNTEPMIIDAEPIFNTTGGYGNAILPAVLILIIQQTLLLGIGLTAGTESEKCRLSCEKLNNGFLKIILGKSLCYLMIYSIMTAYVTMCVPYWFDFTMLARPVDLFLLLLPYLLAVIFFGMTISFFVRYRENVMLLVVFTSIPFLFLTGVSWPQSNIPGMWQGLSWLIPSTFGVRGYLSIASMGATIHEILPEVRALWIQATVYFLTTCFISCMKSRHKGN